MTLYVDSSAFVAAADRSDRHHERAAVVLTSGERLLTSDHVLVETWLVLARYLGRDAAESFWDGVRRGAATVEAVTDADLEAAWAIGDAFPDQGFSIVDRTSFAVMQRLGLARVAAFDHHFAVFRYGRRRDRAFEIVA